MYIFHLISIDLQLSCSVNSLHCKAYSYEPGSHSRIALPADQSIGSHYLLHHLLSNQSTTSFKKSLLLPPLQCLELLQIPNDLLQPRYITIRQNRPTPPQRNDPTWRPSESPASAITWARSRSEMPEARSQKSTKPEQDARARSQ